MEISQENSRFEPEAGHEVSAKCDLPLSKPLQRRGYQARGILREVD